ncbi:phage tail protein [Curtobacterium sp. RRHDQ10]|uniref:phage tail protein n=1 Tax=Curtobacterium phyllosphaerae TaxID=3413379 RepID=UPI003BEFF5C0
MSDPFLGEIRVASFAFAPRGWAMCNGQLLPVNQNQALFAILGTQYGGDGRVTFALPDLRGRIPVHAGTSAPGARGGEESHVLSSAELPAHSHPVRASGGAGTATVPTGAYPAVAPGAAYSAAANTPMSASAVSTTGGGQGHENRPPFLALNFVIALQGIFPSQN